MTPTGRRPRVAVFSLGGTISMVAASAGAGVAPALSGARLLAGVPGLDAVPVELDVHDFRRLPGPSLSMADLLELSRAIREATDSGADGVVVTQGTDAIEETAYLLDLTHDADAPVVVTGAMRHPGMAGADGAANLLAAVRVAACETARGLGCVVVVADEVHAARRVVKTHTSRPTAFASPDHGPLGHVVEGQVHLPVRPARGPVVDCAGLGGHIPSVALATMTFSLDAKLIAVLGEHADGLVVAGLGAGHVPVSAVPVLAEMAEHMPVILASRCGAGRVHERTYGYGGSETDLLARGLISAGYLHPFKARILLALLLAAGRSRPKIAHTFAAAGGV